MRLVSFNLLHGRSLGDGRVDAARLREVLAGLDPDVLALQEVDREQPRSHHVDQARLAAEAIGAEPADARFAPALAGTPGLRWRPVRGDAVPDGPSYGVALVSRQPVARWERIELGASPVRLPAWAEDGFRWTRDEPRVALAAVLAPPSPIGTVIATHLSFVPAVNALQLVRLRRRARGLPRPVVLLGDLNLPGPVPRAVLPGWRDLGGAPTFPAPDPRLQLDHALVREHDGARLPPLAGVRTVRAAVSDHRALVVDLGSGRQDGHHHTSRA